MKVHQKYFKIESLMKKVITLKYSGLKKKCIFNTKFKNIDTNDKYLYIIYKIIQIIMYNNRHLSNNKKNCFNMQR